LDPQTHGYSPIQLMRRQKSVLTFLDSDVEGEDDRSVTAFEARSLNQRPLSIELPVITVKSVVLCGGFVMSVCPVCAHTQFDAYGGRKDARCTGCGALERGRLSWLILERLDLLKPGVRILNLAPEPFMLCIGSKIFGDTYVASDYDPSAFSKWKQPIRKIDMCRDLLALEAGSFDVVMHNHVLEHLPCEISPVLQNLNRLVAPGGVHMFSTPIMPNVRTIADLDPSLSSEERRARFGQEDHMRLFGDLDFMDLIEVVGMRSGLIDLEPLISEQTLLDAAIPANVFKSANSHRVFVWRQSSGCLTK
jgi:hypothetical protein